MQFQCSKKHSTHFQVSRAIPSVVAMAMSQLAMELIQDLKLNSEATEETYVKIHLDAAEDKVSDEKDCPIPGTEFVGVGKYFKGKDTKTTYREVYEKDKGYIQWIRNHVDTKKSSVAMKRFRLYIECRDNQKKGRLRHQLSTSSQDKDQMPKQPYMPMKMSKSLEEVENRRRGREGYGWSSQASDKVMDIDEWDKISEGTVTLEQIQVMEMEAKEQHEVYMQQLKNMADLVKSKKHEG